MQSRGHKVITQLIACAVSLGLANGVVQASPLIKPGDHLVFYGDSITEQQLYTRFMQQYLQCRYPALKLSFHNAGWGGDTAPGGLNRLERDVLSLRPTIVTLFFGMNDGAYGDFTEEAGKRYREGLSGLVTRLQSRGIRVVVFGPGCIDTDKAGGTAANYNNTLQRLTEIASDVARQHHCPFADIHTPMLTYQTAHKKADPTFTMIPDAVHPDVNGHLVMAHLMLKALGAEPMEPYGSYDVKSRSGNLEWIRSDRLSLTLRAPASRSISFWYPPSAHQTMVDSGFLDYAGRKLKVSGLPYAHYEIRIDGALAGVYTREQLSQGMPAPGYVSESGRQLHDLVENTERTYFTAWRKVRLVFPDNRSTVTAVRSLMAADRDMQRLMNALCANPNPAVIELIAVPGGPNLALHKPYASSDTNYSGWDTGLTDGNWNPGPPHCYATGMEDTFPKHVTIDLEQAVTVGTVIAGTPHFGSTRTVDVSLSLDGIEFVPVGSQEFPSGKAAKRIYTFTPRQARYVRLTFRDYHATEVVFPKTFGFCTEVEVYSEALL